tara:strand:- start:469 stop:672 length:204 start_codon:yes stop_codon:yes gene_type:complete
MKLRLTKFGTISEDEDGNMIFANFEYEGHETKTINGDGGEYEITIANLIIDRIKGALLINNGDSNNG